MADATSSVLVQRPPLTDIKVPFEGDLLQRQAVAERLTAYVQRLQVGAVVAIDAPWGEGKTWFGRHWAKHLEQQGHRVGFLDAFGQDYAEDAFMVLSAAILKLCTGDATVADKVKHGAGEVMRALLPVATKALIHVATTAVGAGAVVEAVNKATDLDLGADEFAAAAKQAGDKAGDVTSAWVKRRLGQWEAEQKSVAGFRQILAEFASETYEQTKKPVVIVVDELDRCRPAFAVALLERIKHFFDVPHLVFVLLMNRDQLEKAIRGVYGAETDAATYLGKFLHLSLRLPKTHTRSVTTDHPARRFIATVMTLLGLQTGIFADHFAACALLFNLSLREIERGCTLFALTDGRQEMLRAYLIALKLKRPDLYQALRDPLRTDEAHRACFALLEEETSMLVRAESRRSRQSVALHDTDFPGPYFNGLLYFHGSFTGHSNSVLEDAGRKAQQAMSGIFGPRDTDRVFGHALSAIDLDIQ
ncbi:KAP family P-loop NTPase fold protein [Cupriavidus basilensis]|uniref:KAP family P-loop NTPase fold protein n=1 Tax=Cupriavidus basilensis TaxID=68895 RepID=UPI0007516F03|nr:P-loop NTPase fold protein [Cupriavidus basilensis]